MADAGKDAGGGGDNEHQQGTQATGFNVDKSKVDGKKGQMPLLMADQYADVQIPELDKWDVSNIKLDATVIAVGKRRTGKSWCFRNIMYEMKDKIPAGIVISQTDELNKFWREYVPSKYIYKKYQPEILDAVFARQKAILNAKNLTDKEKEEKAPFFVLLDDVISDQRLKYDENLMELFVAGRHYKIFTLITTQHAKAITPTIRGNTDYALICKTMQGRQREALWEDFGDFMTKDGFFTILDEYTENNEVIVFDTSENTSNPMEMVKWWKAMDPGKFKMGSKEYWESANKDYQTPPGPKNYAATGFAQVDLPVPYKSIMQEQAQPSGTRSTGGSSWVNTVYGGTFPQRRRRAG